MRQVEVSRTIVFDDPRRARGFFESLIQRVPHPHLHHPRRPPRRDLLHQGLQPDPQTTAPGRPATSTAPGPPRPAHPRPRRTGIHHQRTPPPCRMKLVTTSRLPTSQYD
jgi:hypothetical protein